MVNFDNFLDDFLARYPDVDGAMITDDKGTPIASLFIDEEQATILSGLAAAMISTSEWIVTELDEDIPDDIMLRLEHAYVQIVRMKKDKVLIAIMKKDIKLSVFFNSFTRNFFL
nr:roadblock/LC7 domain-containing protein [Candidatus Sigynarchaeota archaeon]